MTKELIKCRVCLKKIEVRKHNRQQVCDSDEGIFWKFENNATGVWFCNECWNEMFPEPEMPKSLQRLAFSSS